MHKTLSYLTLMDDYVNELLRHTRSIDALQTMCYDMGDVVLHLFDEDIERLFTYKDEDHQGIACVVLKHNDKYIWLYDTFGSCSGCDDWIGGHVAHNNAIISRLVKNIKNNIVSEMSDLTFPYESDFINPEFLKSWDSFGIKFGFLEKSIQKAMDLKEIREVEYQNKKKDLLVQSQRHEQSQRDEEDQRMRIYSNELLNDLEDTLVFLEKTEEPWFTDKLQAKVRLITYCVKELDNNYHDDCMDERYKRYHNLRNKAILLIDSLIDSLKDTQNESTCKTVNS